MSGPEIVQEFLLMEKVRNREVRRCQCYEGQRVCDLDDVEARHTLGRVSGTTRYINLIQLGSLLLISLRKPMEVTSWWFIVTGKTSAKGGGRKKMSVL
jgi:hypothetical protein